MHTWRGRGLRKRWDKILRWRHSKIHCTHCDARRREKVWVFPETLEVQAGRLSGSSDSERIVLYELDSSWVEACTMGFSQTSIFIFKSLGRPHEQRPMASRREQVSALFFVAWTQRPLTESFPWATEGPNPLKETLTFKKELFWQTAPGSLPAGLNAGVSYSSLMDPRFTTLATNQKDCNLLKLFWFESL